jgi:hypothetical protein
MRIPGIVLVTSFQGIVIIRVLEGKGLRVCSNAGADESGCKCQCRSQFPQVLEYDDLRECSVLWSMKDQAKCVLRN